MVCVRSCAPSKEAGSSPETTPHKPSCLCYRATFAREFVEALRSICEIMLLASFLALPLALQVPAAGHRMPQQLHAPVVRTHSPAMGLFDGFAKAFENDDTLGERGEAGLSKKAQTRTVTWIGPKGQKKTSTCVPGQALREVARGSGIPIKYDCNEGTCKTCLAKVGNSQAKICVTKMPNKDVTIKWGLKN